MAGWERRSLGTLYQSPGRSPALSPSTQGPQAIPCTHKSQGPQQPQQGRRQAVFGPGLWSKKTKRNWILNATQIGFLPIR